MVYTSFPRDSFIVVISMYFGATLEVACSSCHGDLVIYYIEIQWHIYINPLCAGRYPGMFSVLGKHKTQACVILGKLFGIFNLIYNLHNNSVYQLWNLNPDSDSNYGIYLQSTWCRKSMFRFTWCRIVWGMFNTDYKCLRQIHVVLPTWEF